MGITNPLIDETYEVAMKAGATGVNYWAQVVRVLCSSMFPKKSMTQ